MSAWDLTRLAAITGEAAVTQLLANYRSRPESQLLAYRKDDTAASERIPWLKYSRQIAGRRYVSTPIAASKVSKARYRSLSA